VGLFTQGASSRFVVPRAEHASRHAVLGHREARLAQTYQVYDHLKEKAAALKAWDRELLRVLAGRKKAGQAVLAFVRQHTTS